MMTELLENIGWTTIINVATLAVVLLYHIAAARQLHRDGLESGALDRIDRLITRIKEKVDLDKRGDVDPL